MKRLTLIVSILFLIATSIFAVQLNEGFENGFPPQDWENTIISGHAWVQSTNFYTGYHAAGFNGTSNRGSEGVLITPRLDLTASETDELSFWYKAADWSEDQNELYIEISTDGTETWIEIDHLLNAEEYESHTYNLETYAQTNNAYIRFRAIDDYGYPTLLDEIVGPEIYIDALSPQLISNVSPLDDSINQPITTSITWDFGANTETYDLYFDTVNPPVVQVVTDGTASVGSYTPSSNLLDNTTYYWKVVSKNSVSEDTNNQVYSFTTIDLTPGLATSPSPDDNAMNVSIGTTLTWDFGVNTETYDLYFDTVNPPVAQVITDGIAGASGTYIPGRLSNATTYYWKVVAKNEISSIGTESLFNFTTNLGSDVIAIGNGSVVDQGLPIEPFYYYSYSQSIYLQSEVNVESRRIEKIWYHYNGSTDLEHSTQWVIYMGHTNLTEFASTSDWIPIDNLTQVASVALDPYPTDDGWIEFNLDSPFSYNNTDNLVIAVEENQTGCESSTDEFFCTTVEESRSIMYRSDSNNPDPTEPPTASYLRTSIPNIRIQFGDVPELPEFSINPDSYDFGMTYINSLSDAHSFTIINNGGADLVINNQVAMETGTYFSINDSNSYPLTLAPTQSASFEVIFQPVSEGIVSDNIVIVDNVTRETHNIPVQGEGFDPIIADFPYTQSFDTAEFPLEWVGNPDSNNNGWQTYQGLSYDYAASSEHTGNSGYMMFLDDSDPNVIPAHLYTPTFNFSSLTNPVLTFYYWIGKNANTTELHIDVVNGETTDESVATFASPEGQSEWMMGFVNLTEYAGQTVSLDFRAMESTSFYGDITIDDIYIFDNTIPPAVTTLVSPADESVDQLSAGTLEWNSVPFADGYYLSFGSDNPPTNILDGVDQDDATTYNYSDLAGGITYYWQVIPYNVNGNATDCPVWSFTTYGSTPEEIVMTAPENLATGISEYTTFQWDADSWATGYYLYVSLDNEDFIQTDVGNYTGVILTSPLDYNTTYYWYVTGYNSNGEGPAPVATYSFTTLANPNFGGDGTLYDGYYFANSTVNGSALGYQPTFEWVDISETGTVISLGDDASAQNVPIGFTFNYFGNDYTELSICSNGTIQFGTVDTNWQNHENLAIPNSSVPNDVIAFASMDSNPEDIPSVLYYGNDAAGNFVYTAMMYNDYGDLNEYIDVQVILYPSGRIKIQYQNYLNPNGDSGVVSIAGDACIGIENADGTIGIQYRNNGVGGPISNDLAIAFATSVEELVEPPTPLDIPANISLSYDGSLMNLTWDAVSGATLYKVYVEETPEFEANELTYLSSWPTNSATMDASLLPGNHYFVKVTATDEAPVRVAAPVFSISQRVNLRNLRWIEYIEPKPELGKKIVK